jgi:hypothetical protein
MKAKNSSDLLIGQERSRELAAQMAARAAE